MIERTSGGSQRNHFFCHSLQDNLVEPRMSLFKEVGDNREEEAVLALELWFFS